MRLWLVRHAPTVAPAGLCYGRLDVQADVQATLAAADRLHDALPPCIALRMSPARRCRQLADALQRLRPGTPLQVDERLQELDFGDWEGRPWAAIGAAAVDCWRADFADHAPGGGESVAALLQRVLAALDAVRAAAREEAWITHAGVIRAVNVLLAGGRSVQRASDWPAAPVPFGSARAVELDAGFSATAQAARG